MPIKRFPYLISIISINIITRYSVRNLMAVVYFSTLFLVFSSTTSSRERSLLCLRSASLTAFAIGLSAKSQYYKTFNYDFIADNGKEKPGTIRRIIPVYEKKYNFLCFNRCSSVSQPRFSRCSCDLHANHFNGYIQMRFLFLIPFIYILAVFVFS